MYVPRIKSACSFPLTYPTEPSYLLLFLCILAVIDTFTGLLALTEIPNDCAIMPSCIYILSTTIAYLSVIEDNVSKGSNMRNRYNQVPHLTQDTNGKVTNSQLDTTNESKEVSPFVAGDHKAHINKVRVQRSGINTIKDHT